MMIRAARAVVAAMAVATVTATALLTARTRVLAQACVVVALVGHLVATSGLRDQRLGAYVSVHVTAPWASRGRCPAFARAE